MRHTEQSEPKQIEYWQANNGMWYMAVCVQTRYGRAGFVLSNQDLGKVTDFAHSMPNRIGYVSCNSFDEAIKRAGMMERDEPGAWGVIAA